MTARGLATSKGKLPTDKLKLRLLLHLPVHSHGIPLAVMTAMEASQEQGGYCLKKHKKYSHVASYNSQYIPPRGLPAVKNAMKASQEQGGYCLKKKQ